MKKITYLILFILFQVTTVVTISGQSRGVVKGHIIDAKTSEHLQYATVEIVGTTIGTVADETGHFSILKAPVGKQTVKVSLVGYSPSEQIVHVKANGSVSELSFVLKEDVMTLDQIVVSSSRSVVTRQKSPTLVTVMPADIFLKVGAPTLSDGLSFQTGVRVENNCQNCGFTQVRINGLEGSYSQVLVDSRPTFSALTGVYGLEQIPANMIDRVEVIRGGGSALFGSSAIGGVINVITKSPDYSSAEFSTDLTAIGSGSYDSNTTANATYVTHDQRSGFTLYGQNRKRTSYDVNGDGYSDIPELESQVVGMRAFFKLTDYSKLSLQYDAVRDFRRGGNKLDTPASMLDFMNEEYYKLNNDSDPDNDVELVDIAEQAVHVINAGGASFDLFSHDYKRKFNLYSSMQHTSRESVYNGFGDAKDFTIVSGSQFTSQFDKFLFMPSEFIAGLEHNYNSLLDRHYPLMGEITPIEQDVQTYSAFVQNEWKSDKFGFLVGVRSDKHTLLDNVVWSPRLNFRYNPSDKFNFRLTYSTGFRAPQIFDEDLHITIVGGEQMHQVLADDLKQESSQSFSGSVDMYYNVGSASMNFLVEGFYTVLQDAFAVSDPEEVNGVLVQQRYNSSGATIYGLALETRLSVPDLAQFQIGATFQNSKYDEAQDVATGVAKREFMRSPDVYGYLTATVPVTKSLDFIGSGTYTGKMYIPHVVPTLTDDEFTVLEESRSFFDLNLKLDYEFSLSSTNKLNIHAGMLNVFNSFQDDLDVGAGRDAGYIYGPMLPRRFQVGAKLAF